MAEGMLPPLVLELRAKATELISEVRTAQGEVTAAAEKTELSAAKIEQAWAGASASTKAAVLQAQGAVESAGAKVAAARAEQETAAKGVTDAENALARAIEKEGTASSAAADAEKVLADAKGRLEAASAKVTSAERTEEASKQRMIATNEKLVASTDEQSGALSKFGKTAAIGLAGAAIAVGVESTKMAVDFQSQVERLHTAAGESQANMQTVSSGILATARATGTSTTELTAGMYQIESAGFHGADALKVLQASAEGAKNEGADMKSVGNALTTVMTDLGAKSGESAKLMSQMVAAVGQGKMTMDDLAGSIHTVLPNAAKLGITFPQVAGALATMTAQGVSAEQAAQNLNHVIVKMAAPTASMTSAMASYGINAQDLSKNLGKNGLTGTMDILVKAISDHMGPAGTTIMSTFNQSKQAGANLQTMLKGMTPQMADLSKKFLDGSMSAKDYTKATGEMGAAGDAQGKQFKALADKAKGFNDFLKSGKSDSQTFTQAMYAMTGDQTGLQVALHLTGDAAGTFSDNVKKIGDTTADAGGHVKDWAETSKTAKVQLGQLREEVQTAAIAIGMHLLPPVQAFVGFLVAHPAALIAFASLIGGVLVVAAAAWAAQMVKTVASNTKELAKDVANGAKWVAAKAAQLAKAVADLVVWVARQSAQLAASTARWTAYSVRWVAQQAAAGAQFVARMAVTMAQWVAAQAVGFAQAVAAGAVWIAEHVAMAGVAVAQYGIMAAAATAAFIAENAATLGIGVAIAAVIAGIVWAATHWSECWHAITAAASWAYNAVLKPVGGWIVDNVIHPIVAAVQWYLGIWQGAWNLVASAARWAYDNVIRPVAGWIADNAIAPIVNAVQGLGDTWSAIWSGIQGAVSSVWNFVRPIFDAIGGAISKVTGGISAVSGVVGKVGSFLGFDNGGFIPGPPGAPKLVVAHGGEYVLSRDMLAGKQSVDDSILSSAKSANGYTPAGGGGGTETADQRAARLHADRMRRDGVDALVRKHRLERDMSQAALAGGGRRPAAGGGGQTVIVNAYSQASPAALASAMGWELRKRASA